MSNNDNNTQVSNNSGATQAANLGKCLLAGARIDEMLEEQRQIFFEQLQQAIGGASYRQPSGSIKKPRIKSAKVSTECAIPILYMEVTVHTR